MIAAIEVVMQKTLADCGVAALAMLLGKPYRTVAEEAIRQVPKVMDGGLYSTQMVRIAKRLGVPLKLFTKRMARVKLREGLLDTGLLTVYKTEKGKKREHVVTLFEGVVFNPGDGLAYRLDAYLAQGKWNVNGYLEVVE